MKYLLTMLVFTFAVAAVPAEARRAQRFAPECGVSMPCVGFDVAAQVVPVRARAAARLAVGRRGVGAASGFAVGIGGFGVVARARAYVGMTGPQLGLPSRLWCSDFMNMVTGGGTGSRLAKSWLAKPRVAPQPGAVAVMGRRGGGHVCLISADHGNGTYSCISGNGAGRRVVEHRLHHSQIISAVMP